MNSGFFWQRDLDPNESLAPVTAESIRRAESQLGVTLPELLVQLLQQRNGGTPRNRAYFIPKPFQVAPWLGNPIDVEEIYSLDDITHQQWCDAPTGLVGIGAHLAVEYPICLDYRDVGPHGEPRVTCLDGLSTPYVRRWWRITEDVAQSMKSPPICTISDCFESFVSGLVSAEQNDCFRIDGGTPEEIWRAVAEAFELIENEPIEFGGSFRSDFPGGFTHYSGAHRTWRNADLSSHAYFSFGPNIDEGRTAGFPEHPPTTYILRVDADPLQRDDLHRLLAGMLYETTQLHEVDWDLWKHAGRSPG